eukprot:scaffold2724_cov260-Pinguiococcus_pyrenoidosus.AAC.30
MPNIPCNCRDSTCRTRRCCCYRASRRCASKCHYGRGVNKLRSNEFRVGVLELGNCGDSNTDTTVTDKNRRNPPESRFSSRS